MEKSKRNITILTIITIAVFLVAVLGATFAYFATERSVGSAINTNLQTAGKTYQFTAVSNGNIEMEIAFNEMSQASVDNTVLKSDNATIDVSLASPNNETKTTCTYDIVWVWEDGDMYTTPDVESLPYTHTDSKVYNYEFSTTVDNTNETDLSNLPRTDKKVVLQSGVSIESISTTATTKTHDIKASIYNLPVEQTNLFGKSFRAHITIDNLSCNMESSEAPAGIPLATYIKEDVYNSSGNQSSIATKRAGLYYHDSDTTSANHLANGANDDTYRYAGADADVNNYVCFLGDNCSVADNLYRIISVDSATNQTKVIKATRLGNMAWNSTGTNTWKGSSLEIYLNGEYLTNLGDKANKIVDTTWKVGGFTIAQRSSSTPKRIYDIEKADSVTSSAKIGLMYASEYYFAALPECWTLVGFKGWEGDATKDYRASFGKDWILTNASYDWTNSRISDGTNSVFYVSSDNGIVGGRTANDANGVRPSFVLSSDVKITNAGAEGVGTKTNPMIIN